MTPVATVTSAETPRTRGLSASPVSRGIEAGRRGNQQIAKPRPDDQAGGAAERRQRQSADQELGDDVGAARAERHADGGFVLPAQRAHQQQVRDVERRNQDDQPDGREDDQERQPHAARDVFGERRHRGPQVAVGRREAARGLVVHAGEPVARLCQRRSPGESRPMTCSS